MPKLFAGTSASPVLLVPSGGELGLRLAKAGVEHLAGIDDCQQDQGRQQAVGENRACRIEASIDVAGTEPGQLKPEEGDDEREPPMLPAEEPARCESDQQRQAIDVGPPGKTSLVADPRVLRGVGDAAVRSEQEADRRDEDRELSQCDLCDLDEAPPRVLRTGHEPGATRTSACGERRAPGQHRPRRAVRAQAAARGSGSCSARSDRSRSAS